MPLYDYLCPQCGRETEMFRTMAERNDPAYCQQCEEPLKLKIVAPAIRTDTAFQRGINFNDGLRTEKERKQAKQLAAQAGVSIEGKRYNGQFAKFPLDPRAFYGDRQEARACCRRAGQASEDLGVAAPVDETPDGPYHVADEVVQRHVDRINHNEHGGFASRDKQQEIAAEVRSNIEPADGVCG